jgi:hypothetical protein
VHQLQETQLYDDGKQKKAGEEAGSEEILQVVPGVGRS